MRSEVDLFEYEPFHSDKLAVPDKKSSYSMQEPLLRLDGATALYLGVCFLRAGSVS